MVNYFIAYDGLTYDNKICSGNAEFPLHKRICGIDQIQEIQKRILGEYPNYKAVVIKNFIELSNSDE